MFNKIKLWALGSLASAFVFIAASQVVVCSPFVTYQPKLPKEN